MNGTAGQNFTLPEERRASEETSDGRIEECTTPALGEWHKTLLPPPHIKLGLMKNFVKVMDRIGSVFEYLAEIFPRLSQTKSKRRFLWVLRPASSSETICLTTYFRVTRKKASDAFRILPTNFLGNIRAEKYKELIEDMSLNHKPNCNVSLKIYMLHSHLDVFPDNCDMFSDDHGEIFMRKLQRWVNAIRKSGPLPFCLTTVGHSSEMILSSYTGDRQSEVASRSGLLWLHVSCTCFLNI